MGNFSLAATQVYQLRFTLQNFGEKSTRANLSKHANNLSQSAWLSSWYGCCKIIALLTGDDSTRNPLRGISV
jgi:hypothetical protein